MQILIGTDYYFPSVGGQQIVLKEISERLSHIGHSVSIATSRMTERRHLEYNNVKIKEFDISGSYVHGLKGNIEEYQNFVLNSNFDVIMIKAAQGWTIDALIPVLDKIKKRKIFIPCGFSALYDKYYDEYYKLMPDVLKQFDHLIFYASNYRDINFAKEQKLTNFSIIPNGASETEFTVKKEINFRERLGISENEKIILTVGSFTGGKGHYELAQAFQIANLSHPTTLILNGNQPSIIPNLKLKKRLKDYSKMGPRSLLRRIMKDLQSYSGLRKKTDNRNWIDIAKEINGQDPNKKILITNLSRKDVIQAFLNSDLFVFASNVEYSPLVLFESAAAGLPFITVPVGNSEEIIEWTQGGVLCPATINKRGRTVVDPSVLAKEIEKLMEDPNKREKLGKNGKKNWQERFTWEKITLEYEKILKGNLD